MNRNEIIKTLTESVKKNGTMPIVPFTIDDETVTAIGMDSNEVCLMSDKWVFPLRELKLAELSMVCKN